MEIIIPFYFSIPSTKQAWYNLFLFRAKVGKTYCYFTKLHRNGEPSSLF